MLYIDVNGVVVVGNDWVWCLLCVLCFVCVMCVLCVCVDVC